MTPLEWAGMEVVTSRILEMRWQSEILLTLLRANGRTLSVDHLGENYHNRGRMNKIAPASIRVAICNLREGLSDIGLEGVIETDGHKGYRVNPDDRTKVINRLIEEAV